MVTTTPAPTLADERRDDAAILRYVKMRWPFAVDLAPDGTVYFIHDPDGVRQLYTVPPGKSQEDAKRLTSFEDGVSGYALSWDGKWIAVTAGKGGSEQTGLYLLDADTGRMKTLFDDPTYVYSNPVWRRDSKALAYRANDLKPADFFVYVYDLADGKSTRVFDQTGSNSPADFSSDGRRLVVQKYFSATHAQLFEVALDDERPTAREITPAGQRWSFDPVGYAPDGRTFIVVSNHGGDREQVQQIDLKDGDIRPLFTQFAGNDVDFATISDSRRSIGVAVNEDGYSTLHLFRFPDFEPIPGPPMPKGVVGNVRMRSGTLLYTVDNANTPGIVFRARPGETPQPVTRADTQGINVREFPLPELIHYKSHDGLRVPAFLYLPPGHQKGKPIPFIVQYHGGPEGQYRPSFNKTHPYFLSRGIGIIAPNVRGSSGYGTKYVELDNYKNRMDSVRDGVWAAKWLVENGYAKPKRIGAWGGSYGGYMVMSTITEAPELFGAACDVVGIVNMETFLRETKDYRRKLREAEYGPLEDSEFLRSISPIHKVDKIDCPLLIVHGLNDPRVPVGEALQIANELRRRKKPVDLLIFPDEGHGFAKEKNRLQYYETAADFFEQHLVSRGETDSEGLRR